LLHTRSLLFGKTILCRLDADCHHNFS
jgi:hypothetical protein